MNAPRIVAAIAALAIGFGVTLVGVQLVDDEPVVVTADPSVGEPAGTDDDPSTADDAVQDDAAQAEADADPPADADVIDATTLPPSVDESTADDLAEPSQQECELLLVVATGSGEVVILSEELGEFEVDGDEYFFPGTDVTIADEFRARDILLLDGELDERFGGRSARDCETGTVYDATIVVDLQLTDAGDVVGQSGDRRAREDFPCSSEAFDVIVGELTTEEQGRASSDVELFTRVIAKRLATFGGDSIDGWTDRVGDEFEGFVVADDGCGDDVDDAFFDGGGIGFFCAAANVSADDRLFEFLDSVVGELMLQCSYEPEQGVT